MRLKTGRGAVARFQREMARLAGPIASAMMADTAVDMALELRQQAEDNTRSMLGTEPGAPDLAESWHAGKTITYGGGAGSDSESRAALAGWKPGDSMVVWNPVFYGWFHENGTVKHPAKHFFRGAIETVAGKYGAQVS